jgi:hypothetical protein
VEIGDTRKWIRRWERRRMTACCRDLDHGERLHQREEEAEASGAVGRRGVRCVGEKERSTRFHGSTCKITGENDKTCN